jgi:hypothetical protein
MSRSFQAISAGPARTVRCAWHAASKGTWWAQHREASLNWLAFGLLLAAWNASDNDSAAQTARPPGLRGYSFVSVRAATVHPLSD